MSKRIRTEYVGVYYRMTPRIGTGGKGLEKSYYITFKVNGRKIEEAVGKQFIDAMTPAKAARIRADRIEGRRESRKDTRERIQAEAAAAADAWTIDRLADEYFKGRRQGKARDVDRGRYDKYLKPVFGGKEPGELIRLDCDRLRIRLLKKLKPQTVAHVLNVLTWIINFGYHNGFTAPLAFKITKPVVSNLKTENLTDSQLKALLKAISESDHPYAGDMMLLALFTGMRRGEMFKLTWADVDFDRHLIAIRDPKGKVNEIIPMSEAAAAILSDRPRVKGVDHVFPGRRGESLVDVKKAVNAIKAAAGLPADFRGLHGLRHVFASLLASSGRVSMIELQKLLTHKDQRMTQRYIHLHDQSLRRGADVAVDVIEKIANGENV